MTSLETTTENIVTVARGYALGWEFLPPSKVVRTTKFAKGALWYPPVKPYIEIGEDQGVDVLWHEIFHGVFHKSRLAETDGWWGEAFCNAFSEVHRQVFFKREIGLEDLGRIETDMHWRRYVVPCVLILERSDFSVGGFRELWRDVNRSVSERPVTKLLGYDPETGVFVDL